MASSPFEDIGRRVEELRESYVVRYFPANGKPEVAAQVAAQLNTILQHKAQLETQVNAPGLTPAQQRNLIETGFNQLSNDFKPLDQFLINELGGGATVRPGDTVLYYSGRGAAGIVTVRVREVMVKNRPTGVPIWGVLADRPGNAPGLRANTIHLPYVNYGAARPTDWGWFRPDRVPTTSWQPLSPGGKVVADKNSHTSGRDASGLTTTPAAIAMGFDPVNYKIRGHLVARVFGGPGGVMSGNIVPMTENANSKRSDSMWLGIEMKVLQDMNTNDAVYEYQSVPVYGNGPGKPPSKIRVFTIRKYPSPIRPPYVPSAQPYEVDNV
jgi:hypothetical protein